MNDELVVYQAAKEVCGVVNTIFSHYRAGRMVRRQEQILLSTKIKAYKTLVHNRALADVFKSNIEEISKANQLINSCELSGPALEMAMEQFHILGEQLKRNLEEFANGF